MKKIFLILIPLLFICFIYKSWLFLPLLNGGDATYTYNSAYKDFSLIPYAWQENANNGFGGYMVPFLASYPMDMFIFFFGKVMQLPWNLVQNIRLYYPFLILSFFSSWGVFKKIFPKNSFCWITPLLFLCNTYILMLVSGGQLLLGLAYGIMPFVWFSFYRVIQDTSIASKRKLIKHALIAGILLALQLVFDLRITYITVIGIFLYWLLVVISELQITKQFLRTMSFLILFVWVTPLLVATALHAYWIVPTLLLHQNTFSVLGSAYSSQSAVSFFSFAKFENTISLLHPNWPENIFGLTHFMRPEFLILPILAFSSLLFISNIKNPTFADAMAGKQKSKIQIKSKIFQDNVLILYFCLVGLLGAFLAKGSNDPFGGVYLWMFGRIPGFIMFRDATKWYVLIAFSYSMLIPYSLNMLHSWLKTKRKFLLFNFQSLINYENRFFNLQNVVIGIILIFFGFLIRPAVLGQLPGTFAYHVIPPAYEHLATFLNTDTFSRTLWFPTIQRYGYHSETHPAVSANNLFSIYDIRHLFSTFNSSQTKALLQMDSIQYVIVPYDSDREIFLRDRTYDTSQYELSINTLDHIGWLHRINGFGKIAVYAVDNPKQHFFISRNGGQVVAIVKNNATSYTVAVSHVKKGDVLIFSDFFDNHWIANAGDNFLNPRLYNRLFTSFILPKDGTYSIDILYTPQKLLLDSFDISIFSAILIIGILVWLYLRSKHHD